MSPCFGSSRKNTEEEPPLTTTNPLFPARKSLSLLWNYPMFPFIVTSAGVCLPIWSYELIKGKELSRPHLSPCGLALYFYVKHPHSIYWTEGWIVAQENERRKTRRKWALLSPESPPFLFTSPRGREQALVSRATDSMRRELRWNPQGQQSPTPLSSSAS